MSVPKVLPAMIVGPDDDPEVDRLEIIEMSLPLGVDSMLRDLGFSYQDVLDGKVPGIDPEAILEAAAREAEEARGSTPAG